MPFHVCGDEVAAVIGALGAVPALAWAWARLSVALRSLGRGPDR